MARSKEWKRKVVWACLLGIGALGVAWGTTVVRDYIVREDLGAVTVQSKNGPMTYHLRRSANYPASTQEEAQARDKAIQDAIAAGKYELVGTVQGDYGPVCTYRITLPDGSTTEIGSAPLPRGDPADNLQEVQDQIDAGLGELIGVGETDIGARYYTYRYTLSNGLITTLGRGPYLGIEEAVWQEIEQLIEEGQGELRWGPVDGRYCYKFVLSDGKPMLYFTKTALGGE